MARALIHRLKDQRGATLVELLVAIPAALAVGAAIMALAGVFGDNERATANRTSSLEAGQVALDRITREIRQAKSVTPTGASTAAITLDTFVFSSGTKVAAKVTYTCSSDGNCTRAMCLDPCAPPSGTGPTVLTVADPDIFTVNTTGNYVGIIARLPVTGSTQPIAISDGAELANAPAS